MAIRAVMFDFGGVISSSPFEAFACLETEHGLPPGFIRTVNATNPHDNAWARLERGDLGDEAFGPEWATEAALSVTRSMADLCSKGFRAKSGPRWWRPSRLAGLRTGLPA